MSIVFPFSKAIMDRNPEVFKYVENSYPEKFVAYLLHSDYRQAVDLEPWIRSQLLTPCAAAVDLAKNITTGVGDDETVLNVLQAVIHRINYVPDQNVWKMPEYWQTAEETLQLNTGDCEDGAILAYVLCRLKGIDADKLMLMCGDVVGGGHCWLAYRPYCYPLNWAFLDWCYWATEKPIVKRTLFYVEDKKIYGELPTGMAENNYQQLWFAFNEEHSVLSFNYNFAK